MMRHTAVILTILVAATAARADTTSQLVRPKRDVVVAYRSGGRADGLASGQGGTVTMRFTGQSRRIRIDSADGRGYVVVDTDANRMTVVNLDHHSFTDQPVDANIMATFQTTNVTYRTAGTDTVAGIPCTNYDVTVDGQAGQRHDDHAGHRALARGAAGARGAVGKHPAGRGWHNSGTVPRRRTDFARSFYPRFLADCQPPAAQP